MGGANIYALMCQFVMQKYSWKQMGLMSTST